MVFQSDSSYHLQSEQTAFNRETGKHSLNSACICHSQILNTEVISEWKGNIEKNLSIEYGFSSGTHLMGTLRIHLKIYLPECTKKIDAPARMEAQNPCFKKPLRGLHPLFLGPLQNSRCALLNKTKEMLPKLVKAHTRVFIFKKKKAQLITTMIGRKSVFWLCMGSILL